MGRGSSFHQVMDSAPARYVRARKVWHDHGRARAPLAPMAVISDVYGVLTSENKAGTVRVSVTYGPEGRIQPGTITPHGYLYRTRAVAGDRATCFR